MFRRLKAMPYNGQVWHYKDGDPYEDRLLIVPAHEAGTKRSLTFSTFPQSWIDWNLFLSTKVTI
jgi:hypothetical protein